MRFSLAALTAALVCLAAIGAPGARAGVWEQVSCVNPDGSAAPNEGWAAGTQGSPGAWASSDSRCSPGSPMTATLSYLSASSTGDEYLQYTPPAGSSLDGGTLDATMDADGYGKSSSGAYDADAYAKVYEPAFADSPSDVPFQCLYGFGCTGQGNAGGVSDYGGTIALPSDMGGGLWLSAGCTANGGPCDQNGSSHQAWSLVDLYWAHLLLSSDVSPQASGFSGSALQAGVSGTGHLVFTAGESTGPGIYSVTVAVDGATVWSGTPNANGGKCVPVGSDANNGNALMFDYQQPCLLSEVVDTPVPTAGLSDGRHELAVTVIDAAGNPSTVLDQTITTANPQLTPAPSGRRALHAVFVLSWRWSGARTLLRSISVRHLARNARLAVRCKGPHCPRLRVKRATARHAGKLLRGLTGRRFTAGDVLEITVTAPHHRPERVALQMRDGSVPLARLL